MVSNTVSLLEGLMLVLCYVLGSNHKYVTDYRYVTVVTMLMVMMIVMAMILRLLYNES